LHKAYNLHYR